MDREVKGFYHKALRGTWSDEVLSRNRYITSKIPSSDYTFWVEQIHSLLIQSCCSNSWFIRDEWWCIWRAYIFFWDILNMIHLPFPFPLYFWCESVNLRTKWRELMFFFHISLLFWPGQHGEGKYITRLSCIRPNVVWNQLVHQFFSRHLPTHLRSKCTVLVALLFHHLFVFWVLQASWSWAKLIF